jgi:hypothetical protein
MTARIDVIVVIQTRAIELLGVPGITALRPGPPASPASSWWITRRPTAVSSACASVTQRPASSSWIRNRGFGAANNVALNRSRADYVLFLNSDTVVPAGRSIDCSNGFSAACRRSGPRLVDAQAAGGVVRLHADAGVGNWPTRSRSAGSGHKCVCGRWYVAPPAAPERQVDWVSGACLLVHRESAVAVGGFDERYLLYEEDVDLCAACGAGAAPSCSLRSRRWSTLRGTVHGPIVRRPTASVALRSEPSRLLRQARTPLDAVVAAVATWRGEEQLESRRDARSDRRPQAP